MLRAIIACAARTILACGRQPGNHCAAGQLAKNPRLHSSAFPEGDLSEMVLISPVYDWEPDWLLRSQLV